MKIKLFYNKIKYKITKPRVVESCAYSIRIENPTDKQLTAVLFGGEIFKNKNNFGSDEGLKIDAIPKNVSYVQLLMQSLHVPFTASKIRVISKNEDQLMQTITIISEGDNFMCERPFHPQEYLLPNNNKMVLDINEELSIDKITYLKTVIEPNTIVEYAILPLRDQPKYTPWQKNILIITLISLLTNLIVIFILIKLLIL